MGEHFNIWVLEGIDILPTEPSTCQQRWQSVPSSWEHTQTSLNELCWNGRVLCLQSRPSLGLFPSTHSSLLLALASSALQNSLTWLSTPWLSSVMLLLMAVLFPSVAWCSSALSLQVLWIHVISSSMATGKKVVMLCWALENPSPLPLLLWCPAKSTSTLRLWQPTGMRPLPQWLQWHLRCTPSQGHLWLCHTGSVSVCSHSWCEHVLHTDRGLTLPFKSPFSAPHVALPGLPNWPCCLSSLSPCTFSSLLPFLSLRSVFSYLFPSLYLSFPFLSSVPLSHFSCCLWRQEF